MNYNRFVEANTALGAPPLVPEIRLHLADDAIALWEKTEAATGRTGLPPPFWAFAWAGGQALARYLLDHPETVRGQKVLDFGAGSGLVAIAAAKAGAAEATAADIDPFAAAAIGLNAAANGVRVTAVDEDVIGRSGWQTILAGDMCYEKPLAERLLAWIGRQAKSGTAVYLGDPGRNYFPHSGLRKCAAFRVPTSLALEDREFRETGVFRVT